MDKEKFLQELRAIEIRGKNVTELYQHISGLALRYVTPDERSKRCVHYPSIELLIGRVFYNNLLELGVLREVAETLKEKGPNIHIFKEIEDAALGNGGVGRLAACYCGKTCRVLYGFGCSRGHSALWLWDSL